MSKNVWKKNTNYLEQLLGFLLDCPRCRAWNLGYQNEDQLIPKTFSLSQNYPNPFNPHTVISYQLPVISEVNLSIYNLLGQKVTTLVNETQQVGSYQVEWDANEMASGIYYYRIEAGKFQDVKKMVLIR